MRKREKTYDPFSEETVKKERRFPVWRLVLIFIFLIIQVLAIAFSVRYKPTPQDRIESYQIIAEPKSNGSVDIEYRFVWTALDTSEELTWIDIGVPNKYFTFIEHSDSISYCENNSDGSYSSVRLYLDRPYIGGETLTFSFKINQRELLCKDDDGYFYEFVPGWFNSTPVENYSFIWKSRPTPVSVNTESYQSGNPIWYGSMPCGSYVKMVIRYDADAFSGASTVNYEPFYDGGVSNELKTQKYLAVGLAVVLCVFLLGVQIYYIDSFVSYGRGRGFLRGYGYHIHTYGRTNPLYLSAWNKHHPKDSGGGRHHGGGCACACACACAGGGRAGCSQKDTTAFPIRKNKE